VTGPSASITYGELVTAVESLASGLQSIDATPGSRVGICARNTVEHLLALLATYVAGKVWVPLNPRNGRAELDAMIAATKPTIMIADESCVDRFSPTSAPLVLAKTTTTSGAVSVASLIETWSGTKPESLERSPEDAQIIKFSGGSTGRPKPVVQSMRTVEAQARGLLEFFDFNATDANLIAAPLTHGTSCFVLPIFAAGGQHVLLEEPKPRAIVEQIRSHAVTTLYAPPTMIYALLDEPTALERSFPSLRHLIYSAAPMSPARIREVQQRFGPVLEVAYGQVEAPQIVTAMRAADLMRPENIESVGKASSVAQVAIMGPDGAELEPGDVGEIVVQGPLVMSGYLNRPELTAETIVDGWLHTGDLGYIDERGYLFIRGRLREVINTGGFKVFPGDVESVLAKHPAVLECCVFGVDDAKWGEAVHAAVRLADGATTPLEDLIDFVKAELDSVKAPKRIHIVDELPRNAAGKVSRGDVKSMIG
jgi:acyl-CoA synthetase (AMP-forming)/AMP-acid ligase II